jgi:parallel beta-helix repeat protein
MGRKRGRYRMRNERKAASLLASIILVSLLLSFSPQTTINQEVAFQVVEKAGIERALEDTTVAGIPHGTIVINGNDEFKLMVEAESWPGNGDEASPYIIEGFDFDLGGTSANAIYIADTTVHFIIRNCSFTGAIAPAGTGIRFWNVTNCEVSNNTLYDNYIGIVFYGENASIVDNEIDPVSGNIGIETVQMKNSVISGNTFTGGMIGLSLWGLDQCEVSHNTVTGSPDISMYLAFSDYVTISDNEFTDAVSLGVGLEFTDDCTFIRNTISSGGDGIQLDMSNDNLFKECTLERNANGISFISSSINVVEFCEIKDNELVGILLDSSASRNQFKWNVFLNNSFGSGYCDGIVNVFDYNYYDHYNGPDSDGNGIGDIPHLIPGAVGSADYHPLLFEPEFPEWNPSPSNQNLELGEMFSYDLEISPPILVDTWEISDTIHFLIDDDGTIVDTGVLEVGTYTIDVVVTNVYDLSLEGSFTVTVEDTTSPVWISQIQDLTYSYGHDIEIQLIAWDLAGIGSWEISDSTNFNIASTSFAENGIVTITDISIIAAGTFPLTITAYDPSGNSVAASFTITVTESGQVGIDLEFAMAAGGLSLGLVALILALVAVVNTRKGSK